MSDQNPEAFAEFATQDGPGSGENEPNDMEHPEQEAHGGSMAPDLADDTGRAVGDTPEPPD